MNILDVMDAEIIRAGGEAYIAGRDLIQARAAVAELIEAAQAMRLEASRLRGDCIPADTLADFDAALNRVTGA